MSAEAVLRFFFFFLNDRAPPDISPLPPHDALRICARRRHGDARYLARHRQHAAVGDHRQGVVERARDHSSLNSNWRTMPDVPVVLSRPRAEERSEEHTSELQSPCNLVCRLLLEKKK